MWKKQKQLQEQRDKDYSVARYKELLDDNDDGFKHRDDKLDTNDARYQQLKSELRYLPANFYRGLLEVLVEASYEKQVWCANGCSFFVTNLEDSLNMKAAGDFPDCSTCEGTGFIKKRRGKHNYDVLCNLCNGTGKQQLKEPAITRLRLPITEPVTRARLSVRERL